METARKTGQLHQSFTVHNSNFIKMLSKYAIYMRIRCKHFYTVLDTNTVENKPLYTNQLLNACLGVHATAQQSTHNSYMV